jgi:hypothetical protein
MYVQSMYMKCITNLILDLALERTPPVHFGSRILRYIFTARNWRPPAAFHVNSSMYVLPILLTLTTTRVVDC